MVLQVTLLTILRVLVWWIYYVFFDPDPRCAESAEGSTWHIVDD